MKKYLVLISLFIALTIYGKNEEHAQWISFPQESDTTLADYYFKREFKLKDSTNYALIKIATTGRFELWVNEKLVIINGNASQDIIHPNLTACNISRFLIKGDNALVVKTYPSIPYHIPNNQIYFDFQISNQAHIVSDKHVKVYQQLANRYKIDRILNKDQLTFDYNPRLSLVGNWMAPNYNYKKFSPAKWQDGVPCTTKVVPNDNTYIPSKFSNFIPVKSLTFPYIIKSEEYITIPLPKDSLKTVLIGIESTKNKSFAIMTPEMESLGIKCRYNTTFGSQVFIIPFMIKSDRLHLHFTQGMKLTDIHYLLVNE